MAEARHGRRLDSSSRRDMLLDIAAEIALTDGPDAVSMEAVAERAGVSRPLVYKHYASRDELLGAVYRRAARDLHRQLVAEVEADVDAVLAQLTGVGWNATVDGNRISVEVQGHVDLTLDAVRDAVANVGAPLRSLAPRRVSLEQIFLREVG